MQTLRTARVLQFAARKNVNNRNLHGKMLAQVLILVLYRLDYHPSKKELMTCPHSNRGAQHESHRSIYQSAWKIRSYSQTSPNRQRHYQSPTAHSSAWHSARKTQPGRGGDATANVGARRSFHLPDLRQHHTCSRYRWRPARLARAWACDTHSAPAELFRGYILGTGLHDRKT